MPDVADGHPVAAAAVACGTPVYATGGEQVGVVAEVLHDVPTRIFDGLVIASGDVRRFVDAPDVARCSERAVRLSLAASEITTPPPHPPRAHSEPGPPSLPDRNTLILQYLMAVLRWSRLPIMAGYAIAGTQLPTGLYVLGLAVCVVLLGVWLRGRFRLS